LFPSHCTQPFEFCAKDSLPLFHFAWLHHARKALLHYTMEAESVRTN
jgi:hypothetical protein